MIVNRYLSLRIDSTLLYVCPTVSRVNIFDPPLLTLLGPCVAIYYQVIFTI